MELMVIVFIISLVLSLTIISLPDNKKQLLEKEVERVRYLLHLASEQALIQAHAWGIAFSQTEYQFYYFDNLQWQLVNDEIFRKRAIEESLMVTIYIEGIEIVLEEDLTEVNKPQIFILQNGEYLPDFTITIAEKNNKNNYYEITLDDYGLPKQTHFQP